VTEAKVKNPLIELLAIKLFEHDQYRKGSAIVASWLDQGEEDREIYREIAAGNEPLDD